MKFVPDIRDSIILEIKKMLTGDKTLNIKVVDKVNILKMSDIKQEDNLCEGYADIEVEYRGFEKEDYEYVIEIGSRFSAEYDVIDGIHIENLTTVIHKSSIDGLLAIKANNPFEWK